MADELKTSNPRGERQCHVGNEDNGNVFEPFVRAEWADAEITRLNATIAALRIGDAKARSGLSVVDSALYAAQVGEIERLRATLERVTQVVVIRHDGKPMVLTGASDNG